MPTPRTSPRSAPVFHCGYGYKCHPVTLSWAIPRLKCGKQLSVCGLSFLQKFLPSYPYSGVVGSVVVVVVGRLVVVVVVVAEKRIRHILNFSVPFLEYSSSFKVRVGHFSK